MSQDRGSGPEGNTAPEEGGEGAERSPQQTAALQRGLEVRRRRAEIKRQLKAKETYVHCILGDPDVQNAFLREVLKWQPNVGDLRVAKILGAIQAFNPRCRDLTERQVAIISLYTSPGRKPKDFE